MKIAVISFLGVLTGCASLPQLNRGLEDTFQAANIIDTVQTFHGVGEDSCYREADPLTRRIIGTQPSQIAIVAHGVGYAWLHYAVAHWLSSHGHEYAASAWEVVTLGNTAYAVANNYSIGIRIGAPNTDEGYQRECTHR